MADRPPPMSSRRGFIKGGLFFAVSLAGGLAARAAQGDELITEIQDWNRYPGDGVDKRPYGTPSRFEKHVMRRDVSWLSQRSTVVEMRSAASPR